MPLVTVNGVPDTSLTTADACQPPSSWPTRSRPFLEERQAVAAVEREAVTRVEQRESAREPRIEPRLIRVAARARRRFRQACRSALPQV